MRDTPSMSVERICFLLLIGMRPRSDTATRAPRIQRGRTMPEMFYKAAFSPAAESGQTGSSPNGGAPLEPSNLFSMNPAPGIRLPRLRIAVVLILCLLPVGSLAEAQVEPPRFAATVERFRDAHVSETTFSTLDRKGRPAGRTRWRIVTGTGNDRENYLASTSDGMLLDFGGEWLRFSTDDGRSWSSVLPDPEFSNYWSYEGAVAVAPDGDVVAVGQDAPHAGALRAMTFKYEAEEERWYYGLAESHFPATDRPSVGVIPGPFTVSGQEVPYLAVMRAGIFVKSPFIYSLDGLNYFLPGSRVVDQTSSSSRTGPLEIDRSAALDWIQPHELIGLTPYGEGKALAEKPWWGGYGLEDQMPRTIFDAATLRWSRYDFPSADAPPQQGVVANPTELPLGERGRTLVDSDGKLHHISLKEKSFEYLFSRDGGETWTKTKTRLPNGYAVSLPSEAQKSLKASGASDELAVAIHAVAGVKPLVTQDLVYRFSTRGPIPKLKRIHVIGKGGFNCLPDKRAFEGETPDAACDFPSLTYLPGGRLAVSFTDSAHREPALAIQID